MTPVFCVVLSSKLDIRSQKPTLAFYLLKRLGATLLGQHCFQRQIFRCLWGHRAQRIAELPSPSADAVSVHTFHETADYPPIAGQIFFTFLLSLPQFMCHSMICLHMCILPVQIFCSIPCWGFTKWRASISRCWTGSCSYRALSGSAHPFPGFLHRRLFSSASQILLSWPLQALFDLETRPVSLCPQAPGRFPFRCCNLPSQALHDRSCALQSTAQKKEVQTWDKSELLIKPHSGHGKQAVIRLTEGQGNWGSLPRSRCGRD